MDLRELLYELRHNILRDAPDMVVDLDTPEGVAAYQDALLWTDATLIRYINDAYYQFARATMCLKDKVTTSVCDLTLVAGQAEYVLSPLVLSVLSVKLPGNRSLQRLGHGVLNGVNQDIAWRYAHAGTVSGAPNSFTTDEAVQTLLLYPTPDATQNGLVANMRVARLPLELLALPDDDEDPAPVPELHEQYHLDMLEWAAWRALRNHDTDGENMRKASAHKTRFTQAVDQAKKEHKLAVFTPPQFNFNANYR